MKKQGDRILHVNAKAFWDCLKKENFTLNKFAIHVVDTFVVDYDECGEDFGLSNEIELAGKMSAMVQEFIETNSQKKKIVTINQLFSNGHLFPFDIRDLPPSLQAYGEVLAIGHISLE